MSSKSNLILKILKFVIWIIFIGLCVQTGTLLFNYIYSLFNPIATHNLHLGLNLSALYNASPALYSLLFLFIIAVSAAKSFTFYLLIVLFKKLNLSSPFSPEVSQGIMRISFSVLSVGLLGLMTHIISKICIRRNIELATSGTYWNDYTAYLLLAAVVFLIAGIFRKGIELQHENDLTI
ncbi:MAG: DUF2975 domain-containing protein [Bacteroidia bacterium]|jgi:hypothetical protein|nr:DUF2975 domain-containing protein [Bacteroidia bacterium]